MWPHSAVPGTLLSVVPVGVRVFVSIHLRLHRSQVLRMGLGLCVGKHRSVSVQCCMIPVCSYAHFAGLLVFL